MDTDSLLPYDALIPSTSVERHEPITVVIDRLPKVTIGHPNHFLQKLVALILMCLLGFGKYISHIIGIFVTTF